jgi:Sec-independent protein translocase protein TatA
VGDEAMTMTKLLIVTILALLLMGSYSAPLQAQNAMQSPGMDMKNMKAQMEQMSAQMDQIQALMKDTMTKMAAADAAMKSHMETEQASMKSQMELQHAIVTYLQTMTDHMQAIKNHKEMMDDQKK